MASDGLSPRDRDVMARTMVTEAAPGDPLGQLAVGAVIRNRLAAGTFGSTPSTIGANPQFEVWTNGRAQAVDPSSDAYQQAGRLADAIAAGAPDPTNGATHFYSPAGQAALGRPAPAWGSGQPLAQIGGHLFYAPNGRATPASAAIDKATAGQDVAATEDPLDVLKRYTNARIDAAPASAPPAKSATSTLTQNAVPDPMATLQRYLGAPVDGQGHMQPSGAPAGLNNTPSAPDDPVYHGAVPIAGAPDQGAALAIGSGIGGVPIIGPALQSMVQKGAAAARSIKNDTRYSDELRNVQEMTDLARAQHPVAATVGDVSGAVAGTAPLMAAAPTAFGLGAGPVAGRAVLGAGTNALLSGADSAARGGNPLTAAAIGGGVGGVVPFVGAGVGAIGRGVGNALTSGVDGMGRPAVNLLTQTLASDTPQAIQAAASRLGPQAMLPDLGPSMGGIAQGLAVKPGDAKTALFNALEQRAGGANGRITTDLNRLLGPAEDPQAVTNAIGTLRSGNGAVYDAIHANAPPVDPSNVVGVIDRQLDTATGAQRTALTRLRGELVATPAADGAPEQLVSNSRTLHNVRQDLDSVINYGAPGLGVEAGAVSRNQGSLRAVRGALDDTLKTQVPGMADADATSAALARRADAVEQGTNLLTSGKSAQSPEGFAAAYGAMQPGEQIALNKGTRGEINRLVGTAANDPAALRRALQGEGGWNTAKLATAFGDEPVNQLTNAVAREGTFGETMNKVLGNSQTAQRNAAAALLKDSDPAQINLLAMNPTGLMAQGAKKFAYDPIMNALLSPNNGPRDAQIGQALSLQGPARDALINQLIAAGSGAARASAIANMLTNRTTAGGNMLLQGGRRGYGN